MKKIVAIVLVLGLSSLFASEAPVANENTVKTEKAAESKTDAPKQEKKVKKAKKAKKEKKVEN